MVLLLLLHDGDGWLGVRWGGGAALSERGYVFQSPQSRNLFNRGGWRFTPCT